MYYARIGDQRILYGEKNPCALETLQSRVDGEVTWCAHYCAWTPGLGVDWTRLGA